jgi:hypothetical protein
MKLKDRFIDFWTTTEYEDYKYDLSVFEMLCYTTIGTVLIVAEIAVVIGTMPIWIIPYLVYKAIAIRKGKKNGK